MAIPASRKDDKIVSGKRLNGIRRFWRLKHMWLGYLGEYSGIFYAAAIGLMIFSIIIQARLNSLVKKYSDVPVASGKDANTCKTLP